MTCAGGHTCFAATSRLARHDKYTGVYIMHSSSQISESGFRRFGIFACSMGFAGRSVRLWGNYMWRRTPTFVCFYRFQQDISSSLYLYQAAKMYNLCRFTNKLCLFSCAVVARMILHQVAQRKYSPGLKDHPGLSSRQRQIRIKGDRQDLYSIQNSTRIK